MHEVEVSLVWIFQKQRGELVWSVLSARWVSVK